MTSPRALIVLAILITAGCSEPPVSPVSMLGNTRAVASAAAAEQTYVIIGVGETLPSDLEARVQAAGGILVSTVSDVGLAEAVSSSSSFSAQLAKAAGVESVTPDMAVQWTPPMVSEELVADSSDGSEASAVGTIASIGDGETFFPVQWAPVAIQAPEAWNAGYTGSGVRVAIVDGGISTIQPDLIPNLDVAHSTSFVPGRAFNTDGDVPVFDATGKLVGCINQNLWHGTHVAGIVAASANGSGIIGIAPRATIIGVKVLHCGIGTFAQVIKGIVYAATPISEKGGGVSVINLSLGAVFNDKNKDTRADAKQLKKAIDLAMKYAWKRDVTVVAAAGNQGIDFDEAKDLFIAPAENKHVIAVSATAPVGFALTATNFEKPTYYTNRGISLVDFGAPGGTDELLVVNKNNNFCRFRGFVSRCWAFDAILSNTRTSVAFQAGTSMAAPMVAGVAALIIEREGGLITPPGVRERLRESAIDLGAPGKDSFYGHGWVNAFRAVQ